MSSERLEEFRSSIQRIIEQHINEIDANNFAPIYDDMWEKEVPMEYISTLTEQFWEAGIEPLEHMNYVPECYAAFLIDVPEIMKVPGNCLDISSNAYCYCYMEEVELEEGVGSIREHAFAHCQNLSSISLPRSIKYIHNKAFYSSENIAYIEYAGTEEEFNKIQTSINHTTVRDAIKQCKSSCITIKCKDKTFIL